MKALDEHDEEGASSVLLLKKVHFLENKTKLLDV